MPELQYLTADVPWIAKPSPSRLQCQYAGSWDLKYRRSSYCNYLTYRTTYFSRRIFTILLQPIPQPSRPHLYRTTIPHLLNSTPCRKTSKPRTSRQTPPPPPPPSARTYAAPPAYAPSYPPAYAPSPYGPPPPRRSPWFYVAVIGGSFAAICLRHEPDGLDHHALRSPATPALGLGSSQIGVIDIDGVILSAETLNTQLRKFGDDSSVKAIILHINSPGGGAAASQEIYHEVLRVRKEKHKKIVASVESVGASGAYYIASACDKIYANDASVVGSIGVIMEWTNYGDLLQLGQAQKRHHHAGELKDAGDPSRDLTPKEQAYFQSLVDNMYTQFVHDVATGRHTTDDKIKPLATGQVWTGQQSLPLGLIDKDRRLPHRPDGDRHATSESPASPPSFVPPKTNAASLPFSPTTARTSFPTPASCSTTPLAFTSCGSKPPPSGTYNSYKIEINQAPAKSRGLFLLRRHPSSLLCISFQLYVHLFGHSRAFSSQECAASRLQSITTE